MTQKLESLEHSNKPPNNFLSDVKPFFVLGIRFGLWFLAINTFIYFLRIYFNIEFYASKSRNEIEDGIDILFRTLPYLFPGLWFRLALSRLISGQNAMRNSIAAMVGAVLVFIAFSVFRRFFY
jgi:hypothetical protein